MTHSRKAKRIIPHERLLEVLDYNSATGEFSWKTQQRGSCSYQRGRKTKYLTLRVDGVGFLAHRLAWFYVHKEWPPEVDHINGNGLDNRIANLRAATRAQNCTNSPAQKSSRVGLRGVHFHPGAGRFRAQITKRGKTYSLGYFDTPEEAHAAYLKAAEELHGEFVRRSAA